MGSWHVVTPYRNHGQCGQYSNQAARLTTYRVSGEGQHIHYIKPSSYPITPWLGPSTFPPSASLANIPLFSVPGSLPTLQLPYTVAPTTLSVSNISPLPAPSPYPAGSPGPIVLGPSYPPIPHNLAEKIWKGTYIDMADLLPVRLGGDEQEDKEKKNKSKSRKKVKDILAWSQCFLAYVSIVSLKEPTRVCDLLSYASTIIQTHRRYEGNGWQIYDTNFRQQAVAKKFQRWADLDQSIWALALANAQARSVHCELCLSIEHSTDECEEADEKEKTKPKSSQDPLSNTNPPICFRWNYRECMNPTCLYLHICNSCRKQGHKATECRSPTYKGARQYRPYPSPSQPYPSQTGQYSYQGPFRKRDFRSRWPSDPPAASQFPMHTHTHIQWIPIFYPFNYRLAQFMHYRTAPNSY